MGINALHGLLETKIIALATAVILYGYSGNYQCVLRVYRQRNHCTAFNHPYSGFDEGERLNDITLAHRHMGGRLHDITLAHRHIQFRIHVALIPTCNLSSSFFGLRSSPSSTSSISISISSVTTISVGPCKSSSPSSARRRCVLEGEELLQCPNEELFFFRRVKRSQFDESVR